MKKLLAGLILTFATGCGSLQAEYVKADRDTYDGLKPCIEAGIKAVGEDTLDGKAYKALEESWETRLKKAESKVAGE